MYHTLLNQQIESTLPPQLAGSPQIRQLLDRVHAAYENYEDTVRQKEVEIGACEEHFTNILHSELSRKNTLFLTLLDNMNAGIVIEDVHHKVLFTNQRFCDMMEIDLTPLQMVGVDVTEFADVRQGMFRDPEQYLRGREKTLAKRQPVNDQLLEMSNGKLFRWNYIPLMLDGADHRHFWRFKDVTEQVRHQQRLVESEETNRLIMNASLDAIIVADDSRAIQYWTPRAQELFGWTPEEALGQRMYELLHTRQVNFPISQQEMDYPKDDLDPILNQILEMTAVHKDGREFPVELIVVPYQQHGKTYYCKFIKDISERKETELRLSREETKYRNMIANMKLGLVEMDLDKRVVFANQGFYNMSGYTAEEVIGDTIHKYMPSSEELKLVSAKQQLRREGTSDYYEIPIMNKAGEKRWWHVSAAPSYDERGQLVGSMGIILDITEQKRMEAELAKAKTHAELASKAKEAFLANMSHEIRTPLNAIIGMIRELSRDDLTAQQQSYLGHTDTAARHLLSIVNSILDLSKIEAGELELEDRDFSLEALVDNVHSILLIKATSKKLQMRCDVDPEIWPVHRGDSARIRQVLLNLLDNAIKFTPKGQVRLHIKVTGETDREQQLRLTVLDTGIGMDQAYQKKIFTKFSQADRSISRRFGGTGLGMPITREIVRLMGGNITVDSTKGRGTKFVIDFTLQKGDIEQLTVVAPANDRQLEGLRLLLVEDNAMNRFIAGKSLTHFGCIVEDAENGRVALELLRERQYDLILMDIQMPELDGMETTKIIRGELNLDVPIIAITANAFREDIDLYLQTGMNDYVTKPYEEAQLFEVINRYATVADPAPPLTEGDAPTSGGDPTGLNDNYDLEQLRSLSRGDESFVQNMVSVFLQQTTTALQELRSALDNKDYISLARTAHRIKPSIDNMGIRQLEGVARDIELSAKAESIDHGYLAERVTLLTSTLEAVVSRLRTEQVVPIA